MAAVVRGKGVANVRDQTGNIGSSRGKRSQVSSAVNGKNRGEAGSSARDDNGATMADTPASIAASIATVLWHIYLGTLKMNSTRHYTTGALWTATLTWRPSFGYNLWSGNEFGP